MDKPTESTTSCKIEGACAGPRCPFARLMGTKRGRGLLGVLLAFGIVHYLSPEPFATIAFVAMWALAFGLIAWVLWPTASRPSAPEEAG